MRKESLAKQLRELEAQLIKNRDAIFKPWIVNRDHVMHYFRAYDEMLAEALGFVDLPRRGVFEQRSRSELPVHRDNLDALRGMIGELAAALESSIDAADRDELPGLRDTVLKLEKEQMRLGAVLAQELLAKRTAVQTAHRLATLFVGVWVAAMVLLGGSLLRWFREYEALGYIRLAGLFAVPPAFFLAWVARQIGLPGYLNDLRTALH